MLQLLQKKNISLELAQKSNTLSPWSFVVCFLWTQNVFLLDLRDDLCSSSALFSLEYSISQCLWVLPLVLGSLFEPTRLFDLSCPVCSSFISVFCPQYHLWELSSGFFLLKGSVSFPLQPKHLPIAGHMIVGVFFVCLFFCIICFYLASRHKVP